MADASNQNRSLDMAHFRFALIAPVIQGTFPDASKLAYYRRVTEKPLCRPDGSLFSYNPRTLGHWETQYRQGGMDALVPRNRCDKGGRRSLSDEAVTEVIRLKEKFPRLNATQIYLKLVEDALVPADVSVRSVQRFVKATELTVGRSPSLKDRKAFEEPFFGAMFQADTCYMPMISEGGKSRRAFLQLILDDHARMIVGASCFYHDNAYNFQKVFKNAVATYGIPTKLYVDHGRSYSNNQLKFICASIGTLYLNAPVRDGAAKGKCERAFRTLKQRWLYGLDFSLIRSLDDFNTALADYVRSYNTTVHSGINQTPMDRFLASNERIGRPRSQEWLDECFMNRVWRKVHNDATVSIDSVCYDAPMPFIGMKVEIRFLPDSMEEAYILYEGSRYPLRRTDKVANSRTKRENSLAIDYFRLKEDSHV
ncbi:MAG: DDE-type integrase/transposase/recombinase [Peptococcaceae bacterium]|nr:DDE-type integrase/transposase/recombinase [Peptococcaceae bacterium]